MLFCCDEYSQAVTNVNRVEGKLSRHYSAHVCLKNFIVYLEIGALLGASNLPRIKKAALCSESFTYMKCIFSEIVIIM
jgi:hypothetical protein